MEFGVDLLLVVKCIKTKNYLSVRRKSLFLLVLVSVRFAFLYVNTSFFLRFSPFLIFVTLLFLLCEGEILSPCRFQITTCDSARLQENADHKKLRFWSPFMRCLSPKIKKNMFILGERGSLT